MESSTRKVPVVFYRTLSGAEAVRDRLKGLAEADRATIGQDLMRVQFRWPIGMPLCRPLGDGLWEVRSSLSSSRIARVFFCFTEGRLVALLRDRQENPENATGGFGTGAQTNARIYLGGGNGD